MSSSDNVEQEECVVLERKDGSVYRIPYSELEKFKVDRQRAADALEPDGFNMMIPGMSCKVKCAT